MCNMPRHSLRLLPWQIALLLGLCISFLVLHPLVDGSALFTGANAPWQSRAETNTGEPTESGHHDDEVLWPAPETASGPNALPQAVSVHDLHGPSHCLIPLLPPPKTHGLL